MSSQAKLKAPPRDLEFSRRGFVWGRNSIKKNQQQSHLQTHSEDNWKWSTCDRHRIKWIANIFGSANGDPLEADPEWTIILTPKTEPNVPPSCLQEQHYTSFYFQQQQHSKAQLSRLDMNVTKADLTHTIHLRSNFRKDAIVNFLHVPEKNPTIGRLVGCS